MAERKSPAAGQRQSGPRSTTATGAPGTLGGAERAGATSAGSYGTGYSTAREDQQESSGGGIAGFVREKATEQLSTRKQAATEGLGSFAQAVRQTTGQLREQQHETVAHYVEQAADQIDRLSSHLKNKDVGQLLDDAQRLARRKPAIFIGSAFAIGLLGARFLKSSAPDGGRLEEYRGGPGVYQGGRISSPGMRPATQPSTLRRESPGERF